MERLDLNTIRQLPKIELHRHLDCSLRWSTLLELAEESGIPLATTLAKQREQFLITEPLKDLGSVLGKFLHMQKILHSEEILKRLAYEACEDAYQDGIRVIEFRYAPTFIHEANPQLSYEQIHLALLKGIEQARKSFPMLIGLICIIQRTKSVEIANSVCDFAIEHKESFLALDLADDEVGQDPKKFAEIFKRAKKGGLYITVHSGETPNPESALWVQDSVEILGADRIGHGIQIVNNPDVLKFIADRSIPLEICPISNYLTQAFPTHAAHPIRQLIDCGVLVTINSDDPGVFGTTLSDDYEVLNKFHHFTVADFQRHNQISLEASFFSEAEKKNYRPIFAAPEEAP